MQAKNQHPQTAIQVSSVDSSIQQNFNVGQFLQQRVLPSISLVLLGAGAVVAMNYWNAGTPSFLARQSRMLTAATSIPKSVDQSLAIPSNFITQVVDGAGPAVVRINSTQIVNTTMPDGLNDPFFKRFFGSDRPSPKESVQGIGSGFIINTNGEILTNAHVVNGADRVMVTLKDGRTFKGNVVGIDPVTDVAVVKIQADQLPVIPLGDSNQLKPGEWAIAIGNPLGLDNTVTTGIISGTGRSSRAVGIPNERVNFIQTDAAINPGNSGGPLLNAQGHVIGMNTAIIQGAQGLGFAIPINRAKAIADQLIAKGSVEHPYLGLEMVELTPDLQQQINRDPNSNLTLDRDQGILVTNVQTDSPAAKAGLRSGDVIDQINGQVVKDANTVQQLVEQSQVGSHMNINLYRGKQPLTLRVQPGSMPASQDQASASELP
jgi:S1-C subfamily serine protease